jgi:hypothetical protein
MAGERFALSFNTSAAIGGPTVETPSGIEKTPPLFRWPSEQKIQKGNYARGTSRERKEIFKTAKLFPVGTNRDRRALRATEKTTPARGCGRGEMGLGQGRAQAIEGRNFF